jgi:dethiobiotin synthetase
VNPTRLTRIIFVTGTDTGVGKTLLTGLLLHHLRQSGCHAIAMKPFCSGSRADAELLHALQDGDLTLQQINPFFFPDPVAPLVSARLRRRKITLDDVLNHVHCTASSLLNPPIRQSANPSPTLLIEGIGGLLVPLGKDFTVRDLIAKLDCEVILVSRNRLGTINHTLLTVAALQQVEIKQLTTVLMPSSEPDSSSSSSNRRILAELLAPTPVFPLPFLGAKPLQFDALKKSARKGKRTLAQILTSRIFAPLRSL